MCKFIQREYLCGHQRFIASEWCDVYTMTHKRCPPEITHYEYVPQLLCGDCKAKNQPPVPWESMIKRHSNNRAISSL
ncbi:hypothetical protein MYCTH_2084107 [Thermothelomyces thermophilus ATCC 42464]|uniref:Uncharacterized protein n=1 Tax=Thermothelomyces thermophilus (strain ATCC 42464 / BCRC 31852 / DSM 1799) TaxID=573729 RepID=G2QMI1_THET4|nr:uncharacterized protein MYCTH_2084107 [Thermothelomyces thermophilus ATCC 42464]AEO61161.1 hypothetical protein MYCTH_2084107 [Thermothelomyces thermophilus ATCC 42464]